MPRMDAQTGEYSRPDAIHEHLWLCRVESRSWRSRSQCERLSREWVREAGNKGNKNNLQSQCTSNAGTTRIACSHAESTKKS